MIKYYNRKENKYEIEKVAGEKYLNWSYCSPVGIGLVELLLKKKLFSKLYGYYCDTKISCKKIESFIEDFNIDMSLYQKTPDQYSSFNEFFIRELNPEGRIISSNDNALISPCDGKISAYENIDLDGLVQIKGFTYSLKELVEDNEIYNLYHGGTCLIFRLCPTDYHRFHFIDSGVCGETTKIKGHYYSVNPIALKNVKKLFCQNKREWSILHSDNFSDVIYMEVGATCVGSIIQGYTPNVRITKGEEKGYFKFGGSTVILFFKKGVVKMNEEILTQTKLGFETSVTLGEKIGLK
ncbi:phosphatidylserine decarboxylase [Clostridium tagluense]|uniref:phosphatidylserine decarboxylase n=1 Tax=Clostridium tagluense TaxID=360422 RepID=UPI001CF4BD04|nr:phosphatidylserine decarboxylase [Clostridium tagluense]MCB2313620.1 phosphatidylserine decarboxylase [Clostridium tagluense]MCB2318479.1 phosphatidylserine decarboxylase [Clostridium tagluense]MCB2323285.1 phosphatidylserine decarboxylase [Clostridium tagluense]MCB2328228.1 phosphatidylserine decarboxylase [Clostridium tagluense]MCB2332987.1 phosphatidylserine decarboxylase [Clostridium tagluense]